MPVTVRELIDDGIACANEGAAIIHMHTYDEASGQPRVDAESCVRVIQGIREKHDVIVYPTIGGGERVPGSELTVTGPERYGELEKLAERKLLEWVPIDPGSVNLAAYPAIAHNRGGATYLNPESDIRAGLALCARHRLHPTFAIYEPGFLRLGAALAAITPELPTPIYRLMLSEGMAFGFPPREYALYAYRWLLREYVPSAPWMLAGYAFDPTPMIPPAVNVGGHVRVGLEDAPFGTERSNVQWVKDAARQILRCGRELATAAQIRTSLAQQTS
jgi:uncharacterized protein (DUF849 family)